MTQCRGFVTCRGFEHVWKRWMYSSLPDNKYTPAVGIVIVVPDKVIPKLNTDVHVRSFVDDAETLVREF